MITDCKYTDDRKNTIKANKNGITVFIPVDESNKDYKYIVVNNIHIADPD